MRILRSNTGDKLVDESHPECGACIAQKRSIVPKCPIDGKCARHTVITLPHGTVFDCAKKHGFVKSARMHEEMIRNTCDVLETLAEYKNVIQRQYEGDYQRLLHNIVSNNAHCIQEVYDIVSEDRLIKDPQQVDSLTHAIAHDPMAAAKAVLRIFQSAVAIKTEVSTYERLYRKQGQINNKRHNIHRVFMNTAYKFFPGLSEAGIYLRVEASREEVWLDYECVSIILYHILDNARKYALPRMDIHVTFPRDYKGISIVMNMISIQILDAEVDNIYAEGYTGVYAKKLERAGTGYGMSIVRELTSRAKIGFNIIRNANPKVSQKSNDVPYVRNIFELKFTTP
jgi:hypothetical protein